MQSPLKKPGTGETSSSDDDDDDDDKLGDGGDDDTNKEKQAPSAPLPTASKRLLRGGEEDNLDESCRDEEEEEEEEEGDGDAGAGGAHGMHEADDDDDEFDGEEEENNDDDEDDEDENVPYPDADRWVWNGYLSRWLRRSEDHQCIGEFDPEPCVRACCRAVSSSSPNDSSTSLCRRQLWTGFGNGGKKDVLLLDTFEHPSLGAESCVVVSVYTLEAVGCIMVMCCPESFRVYASHHKHSGVVTFSGTIDDRDSHIERGVMAARVFEGSGLALSLPEEVWALKPNSNPIVIGGEPMVVDLDGDTRRSARARIQAEQAATRAAEEAAAARADALSRREGELAKLRLGHGSTTPPPKKRGKEDDENDRGDGDSGSKDGKVPSVALQPGQYVEQPDGKGGVKVSLIASEARKYGWTATASATKQVRASEVKVLSPTTGKSRYDARMLLLLEEQRVLEEARKEKKKATQATNERKEKRRQERKRNKQEKDQLAADEESARQAETAAKAQADAKAEAQAKAQADADARETRDKALADGGGIAAAQHAMLEKMQEQLRSMQESVALSEQRAIKAEADSKRQAEAHAKERADRLEAEVKAKTDADAQALVDAQAQARADAEAQEKAQKDAADSAFRSHAHEGTGAGHSNRNGLATLIAQGGGGGATNPMANLALAMLQQENHAAAMERSSERNQNHLMMMLQAALQNK